MASSIECGKYYYLENVSWQLDIHMSDSCVQISPNLLNHCEHPKSSIIGISHSEITTFDDQHEEFVKLTEEELNQTAFIGDEITFKDGFTEITYSSKDGQFTVLELVAVIVEFEKVIRPKSDWFGGVDTHHVYFEGISSTTHNGAVVHMISWGS
jgi:hypothetical protein